MAKRRRGTRYHDVADCWMSGFEYDRAKQQLVKYRNQYVHQRLPNRFTLDDHLESMFLPEDFANSRKAVKLYDVITQDRTYRLVEGEPSITINFKWDAPEIAALPLVNQVWRHKADEITEYCKKVAAAAKQFDQVAALLLFFRQHGKRSTMRYYWPAGYALLGVDQGDVPQRVSECGVPLPLERLRETSALLASCALIPTSLSDTISYSDRRATITYRGSEVLPVYTQYIAATMVYE